jgi:hypothetical protein
MWVVYTKPKKKSAIVGQLIRFFTKRKDQELGDVPSHMQYVFGKRFSLEAVGSTGVRIGFFPSSIKHNEVIAVFEYNKMTENGWSDKAMVVEGAFKYHGLGYDYMSILWFALYLVRQWMFNIPVPSSNNWDNQKRFFCSEMMEFIEEGDQGAVDPNSQMLALPQHEDFDLLFSASRDGKFEEWFSEDLDRLKQMIRK